VHGQAVVEDHPRRPISDQLGVAGRFSLSVGGGDGPFYPRDEQFLQAAGVGQEDRNRLAEVVRRVQDEASQPIFHHQALKGCCPPPLGRRPAWL
jgi:hypothetical protein